MLNKLSKVSLFLVAAFILAGAGKSIAAEYYTIQAGTYTPVAAFHAKRELRVLRRKLKPEDRDLLRIEKGRKYLTIKVGRFEHFSEAEKLLGRIRALIPDAFIIRQNRRHKPEKDTAAKKKNSIPEEYYTMQIGNFLKRQQADEQFGLAEHTLKKADLDYLRIEHADKYFSVRIGKFGHYGAARQFFRRIGAQIPGNIMKASVKEERIIRLYGDPSITEDSISSSAVGAERKPKAGEPAPDEKKDETEKLFGDIATQYYGGQYGKAAEMLRKGIESHPDNPDLYAWYGATLLNLDFPEKAYDQYRKAVELSPDVPEFRSGIGYSLMDIYMDKAKEAIAAFEKALELDPENVSALEGLGTLYVSIGKQDLAIEIENRLKDLDADAAKRLQDSITNGIDWEQER